MLVTLTEVVELSAQTTLGRRSNSDLSGKHTPRYTLREVSVNPKFVVCVREDPVMRGKLVEGLLPEGVDDRQRFTKVHMDRGQAGIDLVVVGAPDVVEKSLQKQTKHSSGKKEVIHG